MIFIFYIGIALSTWLIIGFLVGAKDIFVDQVLDDEDIVDEVLQESDDQKLASTIMKNKWAYLAAMTLMGAFGLYLEWRSFFTNIKNKSDKEE